MCVCGLIVRSAEINCGDPSSLAGTAVYTSVCQLPYYEDFVKSNDGRDRKPNYRMLFEGLVMLQLKSWRVRRSSHHSAIMGSCYSQVYSLNHPADEFSSKGMKTWGQRKI